MSIIGRLRVVAPVVGVLAFLVLPGTAAALSLIRDAEIERTLKHMATPVFEAARLTPSSVEMFMINDRSLNAFVAGGRRIFLNTGLIMELDTPEELLGVIAHETGHIVGGHEARRAIAVRKTKGPALIALLAGIAAGAAGGGEAGAAAAMGMQGLLQRNILAYSRGEEASADQAALSFLTHAGVDPEGLERVLERFRGQEVLAIGNLDPYVLTHPLSTERMTLIERRVAETAGRAWPKDPDREYWYQRTRAKLSGFLRDPAQVLNQISGKPETEFTLYERAIALHRLPDPRGAVEAADRLIAMRPSDPYYNELKGQILLETGKAAEAVPSYRRAVQLAPGEPLLKAGLGRALLQLNTPAADAEALSILEAARREDLADASALRDLATAYDRAGQLGMAALSTAERYALNGATDDAISLAKRAAAVLPNGSPGWLRAQDILALDTDK